MSLFETNEPLPDEDTFGPKANNCQVCGFEGIPARCVECGIEGCPFCVKGNLVHKNDIFTWEHKCVSCLTEVSSGTPSE
jgi:hypothetical protein